MGRGGGLKRAEELINFLPWKNGGGGGGGGGKYTCRIEFVAAAFLLL